MAIETLTEEERRRILDAPAIGFPGSHYVGKALRIIDQLTEARDSAKAECARLREERMMLDRIIDQLREERMMLDRIIDQLTEARDFERDALAAAKRNGETLSAECARLRERIEGQNVAVDHAYTVRCQALNDLAAANAECARLRDALNAEQQRADVAEVHERELRSLQLEHEAECARLREESDGRHTANLALCKVLAAANALLGRCKRENIRWSGTGTTRLARDIDAHLSGAAPGPECNYVGRCNSSRCPKHGAAPTPTRTAAEQRLLDLVISTVRAGNLFKGSAQRAICEAVSELARREGK